MLFFLKVQNMLGCGVSEEPMHIDRSSFILPAAHECPVHTERSLGPFCIAVSLCFTTLHCSSPCLGEHYPLRLYFPTTDSSSLFWSYLKRHLSEKLFLTSHSKTLLTRSPGCCFAFFKSVVIICSAPSLYSLCFLPYPPVPLEQREPYLILVHHTSQLLTGPQAGYAHHKYLLN